MSISAKELAAILGVSPATISMVFNNKPGISEATREMVYNAAAQYGYVNKKAEKNTADAPVIQFVTYKKHEQIIANTPFFSELTEGITQESSLQHCALHMSYIHEPGNIGEQIEALKSINCIGILLLATEMAPSDFNWFRDFPVPIVVLDCYYDSIDFDCVLINNTQGAYQATNYLIRCGHTRIGHLHSNVICGNFNERATGFRDALFAHDLPVADAITHKLSPTSQRGFQDMMQILEEEPELAEAYFADNDIIAAAAMKAFQAHGYRIPEDISIIGFDDMPLCDMMNPALSTMNVPKKELGAMGVRKLLSRAEKSYGFHTKTSLSTSLVVRESVLDKTL
ncbi:MAG: LacI family DNA-binding transcriptional regulator [Clostridiales bacterium]|nr:LacI family DNA-binding transcriptional regulator [Clostridiales bacterium]